MRMIYFIQDDSAFLIKIGFTDHDDASQRLSSLQTGSAGGLILLGTMPGDLRLEGVLHQRFTDFRHHGEWFKPHPELLKFIIETTGCHENEAVRQRDEIIKDLMGQFNLALKLCVQCANGAKLSKQSVKRFLEQNGIILTPAASP